jgi:cysteine desulfurase/selenocysteine lyase
MIETVSFAGTTFNQLPYKFEAGTPDIAGVIGFGAAIDYLNQLDRNAAAEHEQALLAYAEEKARTTTGIELIGTSARKTSVMSFMLKGAHPADVGVLLDKQGVAVRTGNHCAQPIMDQFGIPGTVRASFSFYNTFDEVDRLFAAIPPEVLDNQAIWIWVESVEGVASTPPIAEIVKAKLLESWRTLMQDGRLYDKWLLEQMEDV